jgi:hypothetical protein
MFSESKRGDDVWNNFYNIPENTINILFMGSSLSYSSFNPLIFNGRLGVSSYNTGTALQNIKQSYFNLQEVLKYQSPELIILEAYSLDIPDKSEEDRLGFKYENLDPQKLSFRKLRAVNNQFSTIKNKINAFFPLIRNHDKWKDAQYLSKNTTHTFEEDIFLGYKLTREIVNKESLLNKIENLPSTHFFSKENLDYFNRFIKLCKLNEIKVLVVRAPTLLYKYNVDYYNEAYKNTKEVCDLYNVKYLDYNREYNVFQLKENSFADEKHLNYQGATRISELLATYLEEVEGLKGTSSKPKEPEDFIYSNKYSSLAQTIFKGDFSIDSNTIIKEVKLVSLRENEISVIVRLDKSLKTNEIAKYNVGYYFYPVDSEVTLLETEKDLKRKYTGTGGLSVPMRFNDNYYVTLRFHKTKVKRFKKIKIQLYNKEGVYGESLIINNIFL